MVEKVKQGVFTVVLGALVMVGIRAAEWIIPAPEIRVVVCMADEIGKVDLCKSLEELRAKHGATGKLEGR